MHQSSKKDLNNIPSFPEVFKGAPITVFQVSEDDVAI